MGANLEMNVSSKDTHGYSINQMLWVADKLNNDLLAGAECASTVHVQVCC